MHDGWSLQRISYGYVLALQGQFSQNLIMHVMHFGYTSMWLDVKIKSNSLYGVQYFWKIVFPSRKLPNDVKEIIYKVFPNNACFTHPEHLILAILYDLENTSSN